jgi:hypothetical protein
MKLFAAIVCAAGCASLVACGGAPGLQSQDESGGLVLVDSVPASYVGTPHGLYHQSCVHELPDGAEVDASGHVVEVDGTTLDLPACSHPRAMLRTTAGAGSSTTNGWVEYAGASSKLPVTKMTARFGVPSAPPRAASQLVYFFPGMEPADGTIILQPVLQWGASPAGGGNRWGIASWSCGPRCVHSKLVAVSAGDALSGSITGSKCSATGQCAWTIVTTDTTTGRSTSISTHGDTGSYTWLQSGVLEAYNVTGCTEYPATAETFSHVAFYDVTGALLAPAWAPIELGQKPACNFAVATTGTGTILAY